MVRSFRSRIVTPLLLAVLLPTLLGCGTMFGGTREIITATSAPDVARITTSPESGSFTTPASMSLERKHSYTLTFTKDGYEPATFQINKKLRGGIVVLDVLFTGLLGVIIDATTGGWYTLQPQSALGGGWSLARLPEARRRRQNACPRKRPGPLSERPANPAVAGKSQLLKY